MIVDLIISMIKFTLGFTLHRLCRATYKWSFKRLQCNSIGIWYVHLNLHQFSFFIKFFIVSFFICSMLRTNGQWKDLYNRNGLRSGLEREPRGNNSESHSTSLLGHTSNAGESIRRGWNVFRKCPI